uniref:Uncharacterized protein n=1 Tax=Kalanchoe fedtschenkoi TaxID=63787 RepID=A0A7N0VMV1_KALFE
MKSKYEQSLSAARHLIAISEELELSCQALGCRQKESSSDWMSETDHDPYVDDDTSELESESEVESNYIVVYFLQREVESEWMSEMFTQGSVIHPSDPIWSYCYCIRISLSCVLLIQSCSSKCLIYIYVGQLYGTLWLIFRSPK